MSGCWETYDMLKQYCHRVVVAHPAHVKIIASSFVKTDKRDAVALARLLAANILPEVWVPPQPVRELRALIRHREALIQSRTRAKNRVRAIMHRYQIVGPKGRDAFDPGYWETVEVPPTEKLCARHAVETIQLLTCQIKEVEEELSRLSVSTHWKDDVPYLLQIPGVGLVTAMTVLSAVGDISRFPTSKKLVGYAGLGARVYASGQSFKTGGITKQGRRELRTAMIEAAWNAIKHSDLWRERFERLAYRLGRQKATVAIARKLLVVIWNVLSHRQTDREADEEAVARVMLVCGHRHRLATSLGVKPAQVMRNQLDVLQIGADLQKITHGSRIYTLPLPK